MQLDDTLGRYVQVIDASLIPPKTFEEIVACMVEYREESTSSY